MTLDFVNYVRTNLSDCWFQFTCFIRNLAEGLAVKFSNFVPLLTIVDFSKSILRVFYKKQVYRKMRLKKPKS